MDQQKKQKEQEMKKSQSIFERLFQHSKKDKVGQEQEGDVIV